MDQQESGEKRKKIRTKKNWKSEKKTKKNNEKKN